MIIRRLGSELETAACFSTAPALGNETLTIGHVPGTTVRGMVAARYLQSHPADALFRRLFVDGGVHFPNLYPDGSAPLPRSAYTCKENPGFLADAWLPGEEEPHGVVDLLLAGERPHNCPRCGATLVPHIAAYYGGSVGRLRTVQPRTRTVMRTSVEGREGSARVNTLHSQQELAGGQHFEGLIHAEEGGLLDKLVESVGQDTVAFAGRRRAGKMNLTFFSVERRPSAPVVFAFDGEDARRYAALTLLSDAILVDQLLRPIISLNDGGLDYLLHPPPAPISVAQAFAGTRRVAGWHGVGKLFKQDDVALVAGSTFLLEFAAADEEKVVEWMMALTAAGIGLRRSEGFGRASFNATLHRAAYQQYQQEAERIML